MKMRNESWSEYWDSRGNDAHSDFEADRGRSSVSTEAEVIAERELLAFIKPEGGDRILDAGCGTGINLKRLSPLAASLVGIDYSESMVTRTRKRLIAEGINNAEVHVKSVCNTALPGGTFDKILCISVFQYLNDQDCQAAIKEFVRLSKSGGVIILHVKNLASLYLSSLYLAKKMKSLIAKTVKIEHYRSRKWYETKLREAGALPIAFDSHSIFALDFMPKSVYRKILLLERKYYKSRFLRRYGSEYFIKARVGEPLKVT
jgi:ubiquinone/menaquinone biosynthesis C-methylase UbiE